MVRCEEVVRAGEGLEGGLERRVGHAEEGLVWVICRISGLEVLAIFPVLQLNPHTSLGQQCSPSS